MDAVDFPLDAPLSELLLRAIPGVNLGRIRKVLIEPDRISVEYLVDGPGRVSRTDSTRIKVLVPDFPAPPTTPTEKETD